MERFINGDWELAAYLVTGGAGFIGSHLVEALSASGHEVTVLDNLSSGDKKNIELLLGTKVNFVEGDIRDKTLLDKLVQNCDGVFHLAALVSVPESIKNPLDSFSVNLQGTLNVFESCKGREQIRIVFASSAAVYGNIEQLPIQEGATGNPLSPYGLHKLMCEQHAELYAKLYNVNSVGLRFFNVFGPRQDPSSPYSGVISIFIDRLVKGTAPVIYGDGGQTRDFVYVADVVQALVKAMDSQKQGFEVFNVGRGESITVKDLWTTLRAVAGSGLNPVFLPARDGEIYESLAEISRIKRELNYWPTIEIKDGLARTFEWCSKSGIST